MMVVMAMMVMVMVMVMVVMMTDLAEGMAPAAEYSCHL